MCKVIEDMRVQERQEGRQEGIQEGIKKGIKEATKTAALRMLAAGRYAMEEIVNVSGLTLEEVKKLQAGTSI